VQVRAAAVAPAAPRLLPDGNPVRPKSERHHSNRHLNHHLSFKGGDSAVSPPPVLSMPTSGRLRYLDAPPQGVATPSTASSRPPRTLVLIHAFPLNARMWEPQLALAEHGWRVIAPHLRGMEGPGDPPAASMDDYAGDVIDLLDSLHIHEAVIGGLSLGGYVTLAMFRHAPRYFSGMVLADTRSQADTPEGIEGRKRMLALLREKGARAVVEDMMPKLVGDTSRRERPELADRLRDLATANPEPAIAGALNAMMTRADSTPLLSSIHCPTLIVVGEEDVLTPPQLSEDMHRAIPGSELATIKAAGHLSSLEQPGAFNAALATFLTHRV
jgi:3-oxoadipate enol-lactonase